MTQPQRTESPPRVQEIDLAARTIGPGRPALIIAEVAQAHDGSLGMAHAYIDAAATAGADAVKFQTHIAAAESTPHEPWRVPFSRQDAARYDYWKRMEFTPEQWSGLKLHAEEKGLVFLSSPFSDEAVDLLDRLGMVAWKVASGEVDNPLLLERIGRTGKPALVSSGMSSWTDLDAAIELLRRLGSPVALFQCTTAYPCPAEKVGLHAIGQLRERYAAPAGLSDHSGTIFPSLAAAALGVELLEVHLTFSREMFGPDVPASVTTAELRQLVDGVRFIERAVSSRPDKDALSGELEDLRRTFGKGLAPRRDLPAGTRLDREHLTVKKMGGGIPARRYRDVLGRTLLRSVAADEPFSEADLRD
ncbi:MAG: N-acetylneuraminate synthase family protein [Planctomycetes bacterium]|nr:N-acetylneuraminate synthase family protein [Planctomycetota bacterium]